MKAADFIDAHCHLADPRLDSVRESFIARALQVGVTEFIQGGIGPEDWSRQSALQCQCSQQSPPAMVRKVFGLHPMWIAENGRQAAEEGLRALQARLQQEPPVGLGELGLDHRAQFDSSTYPLQREFMERQLALPEALDLPLVLHVVRAHPEALEVLEAAAVHRAFRGIVHAFTGSWEVAQRYLRLGFSISVGGKLAFPGGFEKLRRAVVRVPADHLVLETDSPDQPPPAYEGRLNEPASLWDVARAAATLRGETPEAVLEKSRDNLRRIFGLK
jgi:TatD DNase family protein